MHTTFAARQGSGPVNARPQVVIVGAGFAGLNAARALRHADADVTLVDDHDYHTFHPLLYQVSTGYLAPEEVGAALHAVFRQQPNVRVRLGNATRLDYPGRALVLQDGSTLGFGTSSWPPAPRRTSSASRACANTDGRCTRCPTRCGCAGTC